MDKINRRRMLNTAVFGMMLLFATSRASAQGDKPTDLPSGVTKPATSEIVLKSIGDKKVTLRVGEASVGWLLVTLNGKTEYFAEAAKARPLDINEQIKSDRTNVLVLTFWCSMYKRNEHVRRTFKAELEFDGRLERNLSESSTDGYRHGIAYQKVVLIER